SAPVTASLMTNNVVIAAPTSTTNMTGFFATMRGLSFTNDSQIARRRISGSNSGRARTPLEISCDASVVLCSDLRSCGLRVAVDILENLSVQHLEMLDDRTKRQCREIRQRAHNDHCAGQKNDKQRPVSRQYAAHHRNELLRCETTSYRQSWNDE